MISEMLVKKATKAAIELLEEKLPELKAKVRTLLEESDTPLVEGELEASLDETASLAAAKALDSLVELLKTLTEK